MSSILNSLNVRELNDLQNLIDELALPNPISTSEYIEIDGSRVSDEINLNDIYQSNNKNNGYTS
ncbi:9852_t:CDS:2 [Entrophospora sp. SA101]|nr:9852_t:CDS:2 [Entrophospora sp. SA101]